MIDDDPATFLLAIVPLIVATALALFEVATRRDLSAGRRAAWLVALLVVPVVPLLGYVVVRPPRHAVRAPADARGSQRASTLVDWNERLARGVADVDEYRAAVAELQSDDPSPPPSSTTAIPPGG